MNGDANVFICITDNLLRNIGVSYAPLLRYPAEYRSATARIAILGYLRVLASLLATGQKAGFFPTAAYPRLQYHQRSPPGH